MPAAHAATASALPGAAVRGAERARARVDRDQEGERHHRLAALGDVVHDLAVQRMHHPDERNRERDRRRLIAQPCGYARPPEGELRAREEQQRAQHVQRDVPQVVAADVESSDRVVERHRHVDERPSRGRRLAAGEEDAGAPLPDAGVRHHRHAVVEDERPRQAVAVDRRARNQEEPGAPPTERGRRRRRACARRAGPRGSAGGLARRCARRVAISGFPGAYNG